MSEVIIYGVPQSSYVRTVRFACNEKGVKHAVEPVEFGSEAHRSVHPWAKIPAMRHGDVVLYETSAICRYIDAAFDGPALQPSEPAALGLMEQWISALNSYVYVSAIRDYALQYVIPRGPDKQPDRAAIDQAIPVMKRDLEVLDRAYEGCEWIAGDAISLADMFVAPVIATVDMFPEGKVVLEGCPNLRRVHATMAQRDAYRAAQPPAPPQS